MSGENYVNTASTATTAAPVGPADLTFTVASYTGWPAAPFWGMFEKGTASAELVRVTNVAGSVLTITRGQGGTSATSHGAGVTFEHIVPASHFNETETHMAATSAHGVGGNVVGTTGSQTIQDKTYRGAHRSLQSDALPAGVTASYESIADNASARDGFVHRNTAGDAARSGFLLQQSGTDRFKVTNTGNVTVTPSSGTAITANGPVSVVGGTLSANSGVTVSSGGASVTGGLTVPSGGAAITGASSVNGNTTVTGTLTATSTLTGGSITTAGTIHANGAIDTDNNLIVDGTSTLTGTVSAGGAVNATGAVTGASAAFTGVATAHGGRVVVGLSDPPTQVSSPATGQLAWHTTFRDLFYYDGTTWKPFRPTCHMYQTVTQSISNGAATAITFTSEVQDNFFGHDNSTNPSRYTAQVAGIYEFAGGVTFAVNATGYRACHWRHNGSELPGSQAIIINTGGSIVTGVVAKTYQVTMAVGDYVELFGQQNSGVSLDTVAASKDASSMSVKFLRAV